MVGFPVVPDDAWIRASVVFRNRQQPERIGVAHVGLRAERQAPRRHRAIGRRDAAQPVAVDVIRVPQPLDERAQALELERFERVPFEGLELRLEDHAL